MDLSIKFKKYFYKIIFNVFIFLSLFFSSEVIFFKGKYNLIQGHPLISSFVSIIICKKILRRKVILNISDIWPLSGLELGYFKKIICIRF